jgi:hypothetical protein
LFELVVEPRARRRRVWRPLSGKKRAAALFRLWHRVCELNEETASLGDGELVHFLEVAVLLVEEKVTSEKSGTAASFDKVDTSRPN